jgi:CheY-like chemotaxis protein
MRTKRILVVEDKDMNRKVVRIIMTSKGYDVLEATNAEEALKILQTDVPDLILMDIALPGMSGDDLTRQIKADSRWQHLPVIALTASAMKGQREQFLEAGCDDYISKPVNTHALAELVDQYLSKDVKNNG